MNVSRKPIIIYGSYGFTGKLIAQECKTNKLSVILSGRNHQALQSQSKETGFPFEVVELSDSHALRNLLQKGAVVIHCAGPFQTTAFKMADMCLETGTHYTDITGEYQVFEQLATYDRKAKDAGITIMPGTGFDVVPSDCLALHLKNQLPSATHLQLAFKMSSGGLSRGTANTMVEGLGHGSVIRKEGLLLSIPLGDKIKEIDFGEFQATCMNIPWGDISTAWHSTGIPNIEVYMATSKKTIATAKISRYVNGLLRFRFVKDLLHKKVNTKITGPSDEKRMASQSYLWGQVWDEQGNLHTAAINTINGYSLTAKTSVLIAMRILSNEVKKGYQTPAMAYGPDLILEIEKTTRTVL